MVIMISPNNYAVDETLDVSKDNMYVDDDTFQLLVSDKTVRDALLQEFNSKLLFIGRVGMDISNNQAFAKKDLHVTDKDLLLHINGEKEFGYYARL